MSNFGVIKDTFTNLLIESYTTENKSGKDLYKGFIKLLKEDEILKKEFMVYKNLESKVIQSESLALEYIKENINFFRRYDKNLIKESNGKLKTLLGENQTVDTKSYYDSLNTLISAVNVAHNKGGVYSMEETHHIYTAISYLNSLQNKTTDSPKTEPVQPESVQPEAPQFESEPQNEVIDDVSNPNIEQQDY